MHIVTEHLFALLGLLATLISGLVPRWVKRLARHLDDVPILGTFLRLVAPPAPAQTLPDPLPAAPTLPAPSTPPAAPLLPNPVNVSLRQEDEARWAAVISSGVQTLVDKKEEELVLLQEQNALLRRLVELQEQRADDTYELVRRQVPRPPAAPGPSSG
ncbi:hypothetical protein LTR67_007332 [Exophiala xenobiotica]